MKYLPFTYYTHTPYYELGFYTAHQEKLQSFKVTTLPYYHLKMA